jgi:Flp pilus assembly protein TadD
MKKLAVVVGLAAVLAAGYGLWRWKGGPADPSRDADPRVVFDTPFLNVKPDVKYVGDERCAACHAEIAGHYRKHPMGRSAATAAKADSVEGFDPKKPAVFTAQGLQYRVEKNGGTWTHREIVLDADGKEVVQRSETIQAVIGSGTRGRAYLVEKDGWVRQSPVSWYAAEKGWDLSAGYEKRNEHFERSLSSECFFCHVNQATSKAGSSRCFETPLRVEPIGCERCHGPGELHASRHESGAKASKPDHTIVNPRRLEAPLREAVCEQCHLQGESRVPRRGLELSDYRPGLPFDAFAAVFVRAPDFADPQKSVGQVEQMRLSQCFLKSEGALGCVSCHDPHRLPPAEGKAGYFRAKCHACHEAKTPCSQPLAVREAKRDDCVACHMPGYGSSNIAHASITDHRVLRKPQPAAKKAPRALAPGEVPIAPFHAGGKDERELGIALAWLADDLRAPSLAQSALPRLEPGLKSHPRDLEALRSKATAQWLVGERNAARETLAELLRQAPRDEFALGRAAAYADELGKFDEAIPLWRGVVQASPLQSQHHFGLAYALAYRKDWTPAIEAARAALDLNPTRHEVRRLLIDTLRKAGRNQDALAEFELHRRAQAPDWREVQGWFGGNDKGP